MIAAALEQHAAHAVPSQNCPLSVGMQAASAVSEANAAQHAGPTANAASADGDVSAITMEVRCMHQAVRFWVLDPAVHQELCNAKMWCSIHVHTTCHSMLHLLFSAPLHTVHCFLSDLQGSELQEVERMYVGECW